MHFPAELALILFVAHVLHPIDGFAIELLLNREMRHCGSWCCAVPMFLARRKPDNIAWADFLDRSTPVLRPATAGSDNQRLAERMRMPRRACARFEGDLRTNHARRIGCRKQRVHTHGAGEPVRWALFLKVGSPLLF